MDDADDYLSDAFLVEASKASKGPISYAERRRQAQREAERKNIQNRKRSRREMEESALAEGLGRSLFERAKEESTSTSGSNPNPSGGNKAMNMMLKMGFKVGQSLGKVDPPEPDLGFSKESNDTKDSGPTASTSTGANASKTAQRAEPIPIQIWSGKEGLGVKKRALGSSSRPGTPAEDAETKEQQQKKHEEFLLRSQNLYAERRAEGRLINALRTLRTLDEKEGIEENYLSPDVGDISSFPPGWYAALSGTSGSLASVSNTGANQKGGTKSRLRRQMGADRLASSRRSEEGSDDGDVDARPLAKALRGENSDGGESEGDREELDSVLLEPELREKCLRYLSLSAPERLAEVIHYLRTKHLYCFWCGAQYKTLEEMGEVCPGVEEDAHD